MKPTSCRSFSPREKTHLARFSSRPLVTTNTTAPVEYLTGKAEFCDLILSVNKTVLIPRIETEQLVSLVENHLYRKFSKTKKPQRILEIGTGSGAISVTIAHHLRSKQLQIHLVATDISSAALELAKKNATDILGSETIIQFIQSDLLVNIPKQKFNIVVANLPYIPSRRLDKLDSSVRDHEPTLALDGGKDGFRLIANLLDNLIPILQSEATVFLEIDHTHNQENFAPYKKIGWEIKLLRDMAGLTRFAQLSYPL